MLLNWRLNLKEATADSEVKFQNRASVATWYHGRGDPGQQVPFVGSVYSSGGDHWRRRKVKVSQKITPNNPTPPEGALTALLSPGAPAT